MEFKSGNEIQMTTYTLESRPYIAQAGCIRCRENYKIYEDAINNSRGMKEDNKSLKKENELLKKKFDEAVQRQVDAMVAKRTLEFNISKLISEDEEIVGRTITEPGIDLEAKDIINSLENRVKNIESILKDSLTLF